MYKVDLPVENSAALAVESRRAAEEARRSRIFNARTRVIGLDLQGLDRQVAEKKERHGVERECQKAYGRYLSKMVEITARQARRLHTALYVIAVSSVGYILLTL